MESIKTKTIIIALAAITAATQLADAQIYYRRDPKERPAELEVDGRLYKPSGQAKVWEFRLHAFLSEFLTYDDNIFLAYPHGDEKTDVISRTIIGLRADLPVDRHEALLGYQVKVVEFAKRGKQDTLEHSAFLRGSLNYDWLFVDLDETLDRLSDPIDIINSNRADRWRNSIAARAGVFFEPFMAEISWENRWFDFDDPFQSLDRMENYAAATADFMLVEDAKLLQQVFAFVQYEFGHFHFRTDFNNDSNYSAVWAGAKGTLMDNFPFTVKFGYMKQIRGSDGTNPDTRDYEGPAWEARVTWRMDDSYTFFLACYRKLEVSGTSNYAVYDRGEIGFEMKFPPQITEDLFAGINFSFETAAPSNSASYQRAGFGFKLEYYFHDWAAAGLYYDYRYRYTNIPDGDYRNHQASLHLTVFF